MFFLFTVADDEKAIEKIYRQYKPLMYTIAYNIIKDTYYAEDIVQIAMQKISSNIRKIDLLIEKRTKSYIFTITRNTALSFYERTKKYNDNTLLTEDFTSLLTAETKIDFEAFTDIYGFGQEAQELLNSLDITDRDIIRLKYGLELSSNEMAEILDLNYETVKKRLYRTRLKLKSILEKGESNDSR